MTTFPQPKSYFDALPLPHTDQHYDDIVSQNYARDAELQAQITSLESGKSVTFKDKKTTGTEGGTFTAGSPVTRTLSQIYDPYSVDWLVSFGSDQFELAPGNYRIWFSAPAYLVARHQAWIYDVTHSDIPDATVGMSMFSQTGTSAEVATSVGVGSLVVTENTKFEIQHQCQQTSTTTGLGLASNIGPFEIYAICEVTRE